MVGTAYTVLICQVVDVHAAMTSSTDSGWNWNHEHFRTTEVTSHSSTHALQQPCLAKKLLKVVCLVCLYCALVFE